MTDIRVDDKATANVYRLTRATGNDLELWRASDQELMATVPAGGVARLRGLSFHLSPEIVSLAPVEFAVLAVDDAVDSVQAWTKVTRRSRDADFLDLRVRGRDPVLVHDIADAFGRLYIASHGNAVPLEAKHSVEILRDQVARASRQLSSAEQALRNYSARAGVISPRDKAKTGVRRRADLLAQRNAANARYTTLQKRLRQAEIAATATTDETVRLVDAAVVPRRPVSPEPLRSTLFAIAAGLTAGVAFALLREWRGRSVRTREQLLALADAPVLSLVPRIPRPRRKSNALRHSGDSSPPAKYAVNDLFSFAESYTRLVANIGFAGRSQPVQVLLVTSPLPGDGKTTVATNLSLTLAREGKRVLLIDGDLRGGQIAGMMRLPSTSGFGEALKHQTDLGNSVSHVFAGERCTFNVLSRGRSMTADPAAALASDAPRELLAQVREMYDMIVIDSPPVNSVADAALLSRHCDGVLVVARAGATTRDALTFAMEQLHIARAPVIGAVLNAVDSRRD